MALVLVPGPVSWPASPLYSPFGVLLHGRSGALPPLGLALSRVPIAMLLEWYTLVTTFLVKAWRLRMSVVPPCGFSEDVAAEFPYLSSPQRLMLSLVGRPVYGSDHVGE